MEAELADAQAIETPMIAHAADKPEWDPLKDVGETPYFSPEQIESWGSDKPMMHHWSFPYFTDHDQIVKCSIRFEILKKIGLDLLKAIGEDPTREGLLNTPERFARAWVEFIDYRPGEVDVTFEAIRTDQMVVVDGIRVYSLCEHHLLPFWCDISIGHITGKDGLVLGLSKYARIAHYYAHRLQIQERLVDQIANRIVAITKCPDVAVTATGTHLCMLMRGIRTEGTMTTSTLLGKFLMQEAKQEFFSIIGR